MCFIIKSIPHSPRFHMYYSFGYFTPSNVPFVLSQSSEKPMSSNVRRSFAFSSLRVKSETENHVTTFTVV